MGSEKSLHSSRGKSNKVRLWKGGTHSDDGGNLGNEWSSGFLSSGFKRPSLVAMEFELEHQAWFLLAEEHELRLQVGVLYTRLKPGEEWQKQEGVPTLSCGVAEV